MLSLKNCCQRLTQSFSRPERKGENWKPAGTSLLIRNRKQGRKTFKLVERPIHFLSMHASGSSAGDSIIESRASHSISKSLRPLCALKTSFGTAAVAESIPPQEYEAWVAGFENYPLDHRYYEIIHESLKDQFAHYYLFLKDGNGMTRAIQPFFIVSQGWNPAIYSKCARSSATTFSWIFAVTNADGGMLRGGRRHSSGES